MLRDARVDGLIKVDLFERAFFKPLSTTDTRRPLPRQKRKSPLKKQGLKDGAGEEGRTPDLMLGKHTL
jgi:hypothetical protein